MTLYAPVGAAFFAIFGPPLWAVFFEAAAAAKSDAPLRVCLTMESLVGSVSLFRSVGEGGGDAMRGPGGDYGTDSVLCCDMLRDVDYHHSLKRRRRRRRRNGLPVSVHVCGQTLIVQKSIFKEFIINSY